MQKVKYKQCHYILQVYHIICKYTCFWYGSTWTVKNERSAINQWNCPSFKPFFIWSKYIAGCFSDKVSAAVNSSFITTSSAAVEMTKWHPTHHYYPLFSWRFMLSFFFNIYPMWPCLCCRITAHITSRRRIAGVKRFHLVTGSCDMGNDYETIFISYLPHIAPQVSRSYCIHSSCILYICLCGHSLHGDIDGSWLAVFLVFHLKTPTEVWRILENAVKVVKFSNSWSQKHIF